MEVRILLSQTNLTVDPGGEVSLSVRIENAGAIVDEFTIEVLGQASAWAYVAPGSVRLFPGADSTAQVTFRPPRDAAVAPGPRPFGIRVVGVSGGLDSASVEEGTIVVAPFTDLQAEVIPHVSRGRLRGRHRVVIANAGSVGAAVHVSASDPNLAVRVRIQPEVIDVSPGFENSVRLKVRPAHVALTGAPQPRPFQVIAESAGSPPLTLDAQFDQRRVLGRWFALLLAALIALVVIAIVAHLSVPQVQSAAVNAPAPTSVAAGAATPSASGGGSGGGGGGSSSGAGPTASAGGAPAASVKSSYPADGNAVDVISGLNGTLKNTATYGPGAGGAPGDQAFSLDGAGDSPVTSSYVDFPKGAGELGGADFSVTFGINTTETGTVSVLGNRVGCGQGRFWDVRLYNGLVGIELDGNDSGFEASQYLLVFSDVAVNDGHWHTVVVSRASGVVSVAVDGGGGDLGSSGQLINVTNQNDMKLGVDGCTGVDASHAFRGSIDDIAIARG